MKTYREHTDLQHTAVSIMIQAAKSVLPIFEAEYPEDERPRQAIALATVIHERSRELGINEATMCDMGAGNAAAHADVDGNHQAARAAWTAQTLLETALAIDDEVAWSKKSGDLAARLCISGVKMALRAHGCSSL